MICKEISLEKKSYQIIIVIVIILIILTETLFFFDRAATAVLSHLDPTLKPWG